MRTVLWMPAFRMAAEVPTLLGYKQLSLFDVDVCRGGKSGPAVLLPSWPRGTMFTGAEGSAAPSEALHPSAVTGPAQSTDSGKAAEKCDGILHLPETSESVTLVLCTQSDY